MLQLSIVIVLFSISMIKFSEFKKSFFISILTFKSSIKWIFLIMKTSAKVSFFVNFEKYINIIINFKNSWIVESMLLTFNDVSIFFICTSNSMLRIQILFVNVTSHSIFRHINTVFIIDINLTKVWKKFQLRDFNSAF